MCSKYNYQANYLHFVLLDFAFIQLILKFSNLKFLQAHVFIHINIFLSYNYVMYM